ncbi:MAG: glycosyltransferase family 4 protein [Steroidobacteraceae bacterium]|jgi:glycosyltransferase involved in cell wall biosynthesis
MTTRRTPRVRIYHNNLWARYKGAIFSELYADAPSFGVSVEVVHVAETSIERALLGGADRSYHRYPFELLFAKSYDDIPRYKLVLELAADLFRHRSELVVIPGYHSVEYWVMLALCILLGRKRAVFCDSTAYDRKKYRWREKAKAFFFRRCDGVFCYGVRSKEYVSSYGVGERRIFSNCQAAALPPGYDVRAVRRHHESRPRRTSGPVRFLYVGRLAEEKGLYDLLDAFRLVHERLPDSRLELAGSGVLLGELKQRVRTLGLESSVELLGAKSPEDIGRLLLTSDAMVLASHTEPWGLVVNEALSYGCPVVVSNVCGCVPELVVDGVTGYVFPAGDVAALCAAMLSVAHLSEDRLSVADQCLHLIGQYTPKRAADEILAGCVRVLETP